MNPCSLSADFDSLGARKECETMKHNELIVRHCAHGDASVGDALQMGAAYPRALDE